MSDEYMVVTTRSGENYSTEAFLNGKDFSGSWIYLLPDDLKEFFFHTRAKIEEIMRSSPEIKRLGLEVITSRNLK